MALPVGVGLVVPTLITTVSVGPKRWPLSSTSTHTPVNVPVLLGAIRSTEMFTLSPIATEAGRVTVCPPIALPEEKISLKLVVHTHVPLFCTFQVFVNAVPAEICVPSGMVTSDRKVILAQLAAVGTGLVAVGFRSVGVAVTLGVLVKAGVGVMVGACCVNWAMTVWAAAVWIASILIGVDVGVALLAAGPQAPRTKAPTITLKAIWKWFFFIISLSWKVPGRQDDLRELGIVWSCIDPQCVRTVKCTIDFVTEMKFLQSAHWY